MATSDLKWSYPSDDDQNGNGFRFNVMVNVHHFMSSICRWKILRQFFSDTDRISEVRVFFDIFISLQISNERFQFSVAIALSYGFNISAVTQKKKESYPISLGVRRLLYTRSITTISKH